MIKDIIASRTYYKNLTFMKKSLTFVVSAVATFAAVGISCNRSALAFEDTVYICRSENHTVFVSKYDNKKFIYKSFEGKLDLSQDLSQQAGGKPDLILYDGHRKFVSEKRKTMTWKTGVYTYQIIAPTEKAEDDISGYLIVKKNNKKIKQEKCLDQRSLEAYRECQEATKRGISDRRAETCNKFLEDIWK
jgi:hypothetical protein